VILTSNWLYSLEEMFNWLQDIPEQIERAVIIGGRLAERESNHLLGNVLREESRDSCIFGIRSELPIL
jgi:hypothetical protein